ncbi:MAG: class I SAM-dependent methyltransferase [Promethearchaeota archaeon]
MRNLNEKQYKNSTNFNARIYLHQKFGTNKYLWPLWIFDNIDKVNNARVLELGCGNGLLWRINASRIPENWEITLSDFSEGMLKDAKKSIGNDIENIQYKVINAENIPYEDNTFDIVIANHMLYHVPDRQKAISEIYRILKRSGKFYATTAGKDSMKEIRELIMQYHSISIPVNSSNSLFENFSIENGERQLQEYFEEISSKIYPNLLKVTEANPLVDYVISINDLIPGLTVLNENQRLKFTKFIQDKIDKAQFIKISSDFGIFICKKI